MKLFNLDLHISVIEDLKEVFSKLDHQIENWSISSHNWVFKKETKAVEFVNQHTWKHFNQEMCERFYERYKTELSKYDGFVVTHTPCFSLLYQYFEKPIIVVASTRYEAPFTGNYGKWSWLNSYLDELNSKGRLIAVANNKYDKQYCESFTDFKWEHIPSLCRYTKVQWHPERNSFLMDSKMLTVKLRSINIVHKSRLGRFNWSDLGKFKGIVVIPYNASCMSVFEYYSANIPLFFPSQEFSLKLMDLYKDYGIYSELSWNQVLKLRSGSVLEAKGLDPNSFDDHHSLEHWIGLSDWYDSEWMPYITYFDSFEDLEHKLTTVDLFQISQNMKSQNIARNSRVEHLWGKKLLSKEFKYELYQ